MTKKKTKKTPLLCPVCGKETKRMIHHGGLWGPYRKTCSDKCYSIYQKEVILVKMKKGWDKNIKRISFLSSERMKKNNPMRKKETREKVSKTLKKIGHKPIQQGGNGKIMPIPQKILLEALGGGWCAEYSVATLLRGKSKEKYPTCYKIDIAHPLKKIAIEVDGTSHNSLIRREQDKKKTEFLEQLGWKVLRFKNDQILQSITSVLKDIPHFSQTVY